MQNKLGDCGVSCAAAKAVASSLSDLLSHGGDGNEVETDHRYAGLSA